MMEPWETVERGESETWTEIWGIEQQKFIEDSSDTTGRSPLGAGSWRDPESGDCVSTVHGSGRRQIITEEVHKMGRLSSAGELRERFGPGWPSRFQGHENTTICQRLSGFTGGSRQH
jgi:hypothetical protein